jgi:hypothetical protein
MTSRVIKVGLALGLVLAIAGGLLYWRVVREIPVRTAAPEQNVEVRVFGIGTIEAQVTCPFRKSHPDWIRMSGQNRRIMKGDAVVSTRRGDPNPEPVQVAQAA